MNILKNYKKLKETLEEYPLIQILYTEDVFVELPVCALPFNTDFIKPVLKTDQGKIPIVMEYDTLKQEIKNSKTKLFYFDIEGDKLLEAPSNSYTLRARLPEDTDIKDLIYLNNEILKVEYIEEEGSK